MNTLKTAIAGVVDNHNGSIDIYDLEISNWPTDDDGEPQDLENNNIISLDDTKMVMCCGRDWQDPMKITVEMVDNKLTVTKVEKGIFEDGLDFEEILSILTK